MVLVRRQVVSAGPDQAVESGLGRGGLIEARRGQQSTAVGDVLAAAPERLEVLLDGHAVHPDRLLDGVRRQRQRSGLETRADQEDVGELVVTDRR